MTAGRQHKVAGLDVLEMGQGHPFIMIHSLLGDRSLFSSVQDELASRYRLIMPNLPPHGASDAIPAPVTIEAYADRIAAMADALDLPRGTHVLGNGFGGFVAVMLAVRHGERFGKFIFADTGAGFPDAAKGPLRAMADAVEAGGVGAVLDVAVRRMFPERYIASHGDVVEDRKRRLATADPASFAAAARALSNLSLHDRLPGIANDVLVMVGAEDQTTPPALSHELRDGIPGAKFIEVPGAGHCPQVQEPEFFTEQVAVFLAA